MNDFRRSVASSVNSILRIAAFVATHDAMCIDSMVIQQTHPLLASRDSSATCTQAKGVQRPLEHALANTQPKVYMHTCLCS